MLICIYLFDVGLIGNKKDLEEERKITKQEGALKAIEKNNCLYHQTSALSGEGINDLFEKVTEEYLKRKKV